jgi:hypothetical protein
MGNSESCESDIVNSLVSGYCDKEGCFGKVIIDKIKAFKMNSKISYSAIINNKIFLDRVLHQNVMLIIVDSLVKENRPDLLNRYPLFYDLFKCDKISISVYNSFNIGTVSELISKNINTPDFIDRELLRCIFQISGIIGFLSTNYNFMHNDLKSNNVMAHKKADANADTNTIEYKMIDLDSAYIELEKLIVLVNNKKYNDNENLVHRINIHDDIYVNIKPRQYINIDIYILILSFIFDPNIIKIIDKLPMFNYFCSYIFKEDDLDKIRNTMIGKEKFIPKNILGPYNYIIKNEINLRLDIFDYIDHIIKNMEKEFDVNIIK